jgi:hypothetical protein
MVPVAAMAPSSPPSVTRTAMDAATSLSEAGMNRTAASATLTSATVPVTVQTPLPASQVPWVGAVSSPLDGSDSVSTAVTISPGSGSVIWMSGRSTERSPST